MNAVPILLIGIPAAAVRFAQWKLEQGRQEVEETETVEYLDAWAGFELAKVHNPPLPEMETR